MPRKIRKTKAPEDRKPRQKKTTRRCFSELEKKEIITLRRAGWTERAIEQETGIPQCTVHRIYRRACDASMRMQLSMRSPEILKNPSHGRPRALSPEEAKDLVQYVVASAERRKMKARELMELMDFPYSESLFKQTMYDSGYCRGSAGWAVFKAG